LKVHGLPSLNREPGRFLKINAAGTAAEYVQNATIVAVPETIKGQGKIAKFGLDFL
jgi:hypothetical protein